MVYLDTLYPDDFKHLLLRTPPHPEGWTGLLRVEFCQILMGKDPCLLHCTLRIRAAA